VVLPLRANAAVCVGGAQGVPAVKSMLGPMGLCLGIVCKARWDRCHSRRAQSPASPFRV